MKKICLLLPTEYIPLRSVVWKGILGYLVVVLELSRLCCSQTRLCFYLKCLCLYHTRPLHSLLTAEILSLWIKQVCLDWNLHLCFSIVLRPSLHCAGDRLVSCWFSGFKILPSYNPAVNIHDSEDAVIFVVVHILCYLYQLFDFFKM